MDKDLCSQRAYILVVPEMGFTTHNMLVSETLLNTDEPKNKIQQVSGHCEKVILYIG